jgi:phosphoglycerate dehydrogenase-like enzyme
VTRHVVIWTGSDDAWLRAALADVDGLRCSVPADRAAALAAMAEADALITIVQTWGEDCAAALRASRISWLQVLNAGIDPLQRWGLPRNVAVSTLGGAGSASIAEHALFLLLALLRQAPALLAKQRHGEWTTRPMAEAIESLQEKRIAVLGAGHIGRKIAALTMAFGAEPIAVARSARSDSLGFEVVPLTELGDVLASCAAAVVALPLEAATNRLLDAAALARLPRAPPVNVSRGSIVDTDALVAALKKAHWPVRRSMSQTPSRCRPTTRSGACRTSSSRRMSPGPARRPRSGARSRPLSSRTSGALYAASRRST